MVVIAILGTVAFAGLVAALAVYVKAWPKLPTRTLDRLGGVAGLASALSFAILTVIVVVNPPS